MNKKELNKLEIIIKTEIKKTRDSVDTYKELTKPIPPENAIGRISRMDAINNKSVNEEALRKSQQKFKNLEIALSNIHEPDFGICSKCNNPIPIGRIMLMPHSKFCVNCAS